MRLLPPSCRVPIVQLLSGGYTRESTPCIAACITALFSKFDLGGTSNEPTSSQQ